MTHSIKTQGHGGQSRTMIRITSKNKTKSGYVALELLFYISFFAILSIAVINAMITMSKSFKETTILSELAQSGNIMERLSREIRGAYDINSISATGLILNTKDSDGINKIVEFLLSGTNLQLIENSVLIGNLNTHSLNITSLAFAQINTTQGKAVKIFMTVKPLNDAQGRTENFYNTVVLRGDY